LAEKINGLILYFMKQEKKDEENFLFYFSSVNENFSLFPHALLLLFCVCSRRDEKLKNPETAFNIAIKIKKIE
jgi:hypothetical protein